jgi:hypothetical protein
MPRNDFERILLTRQHLVMVSQPALSEATEALAAYEGDWGGHWDGCGETQNEEDWRLGNGAEQMVGFSEKNNGPTIFI